MNKLLAAVVSCWLATSGLALEAGDRAPDFDLPASDGKRYVLSEVVKQRAVVLAWFPQAFTSGCTIECKSLTENGHLLREYNVQYFMISVDPLADNIRFANSLEADFPLLSDVEKDIAKAYGVLYENRFALRHTFYIDRDGRVLAVDRNVNPETSAQDVVTRLASLGIERISQ